MLLVGHADVLAPRASQRLRRRPREEQAGDEADAGVEDADADADRRRPQGAAARVALRFRGMQFAAVVNGHDGRHRAELVRPLSVVHHFSMF